MNKFIFKLFNKKHEEKNIEPAKLNYEDINLMNCMQYFPPIKEGKVIKVYDGDTFTIASIINNQAYKFSVRLRGVDCPEIKTQDSEEKEIANFVKEKIIEKIMNKIIFLEDIGYDKYGRILANVKYENEDISDWLLKNHYAVIYDGGKKSFPKGGWKKYMKEF